MQLISSSSYPLTRLLLPRLPDLKSFRVRFAISAVLLVFVLTGLWPLLILPMMPVALLTIIHWSPRFAFHNFCLNVWLDQNDIVLQCDEERIRLPIAEIQQITWHGSNNPPRAKIQLASGTVYTFVPDLSAGRVQARKMIEDLHRQSAAT